MNISTSRISAVAVAALLGSLLLGGSVAGATDGSGVDQDNVGTLTLYDAAGTPVTSGSLSTPIAAYAVGSGGLASGKKAALFAYVADPTANPGDWTGTQLSAATGYPVDGAPSAITGPTATISSASTSLVQFLTAYPTKSDGKIELRLRTSSPGAATGTAYDALDIYVSGTGWSTHKSATSTSTSLDVTPSPASAGTTLTLTATVTDGVAGSVQFADGGTPIGGAQPVSADTASATYVVKTAGSHTFTATFTPTDSNTYAGSSGSSDQTIGKAKPTVTLTLPKTVSHTKRAAAAVKVTATGLTVSGTVKILKGTKVLATGTAKNGKVTITLPKLAKGNYSLKAQFAGNDNISAATSGAVSMKVT